MAYRTYVKRSYPASYRDPETQAAAHLASAAWHLYEAGRDDLAVEITKQVVQLFDAVKPDKSGAKKLDACVYYPSGIIEFDGPSMQIPAPAFDHEAQEDSAAMRKLAMDMCKPYLTWFASRQLAARLDGLEVPKIAAASRPARLLSQVQALCGSYTPDMPREITAMLSAKLDKLLEHTTASPMASTRHFDARYNRAENRYTFSLRYLTEGQLDLAMSHVDVKRGRMDNTKFRQDLSENLRNMQSLAWKGLPDSRPCSVDIDDMQDIIDNASPRFCKALDDVSGWWIAKTNILMPAMHAARDVINLMLACNAFMNTKDDYIRDILIRTGMADPDLEVQPDLPKKAAAISFMAHVPDGTAQAPPKHRPFVAHAQADVSPDISIPALNAFLNTIIDVSNKISVPEPSGRKDDS